MLIHATHLPLHVPSLSQGVAMMSLLLGMPFLLCLLGVIASHPLKEDFKHHFPRNIS